MNNKNKKRLKTVGLTLGGVIAVAVFVSWYFIYPSLNSFTYEPASSYEAIATSTVIEVKGPEPFRVTHIKTPKVVRSLYMTNWVAGNKEWRESLVNLVDSTELNAVVIDIKDYTGRIGFLTDNQKLKEVGSAQNRIPDVKEFIGELHSKGIYVIGRISAFQDSYFVNKYPEYAVKTKAGNVWKDYKGVKWLDVGAKPVWDYLVELGMESYALGFDELNFDYIRFPSDGNMKDIAYPFSEGKIKADALKEFFAYIDKIFHEKDIPISADLFGMTTSNTDDLGIGQVLENALAHFDYVAPMVYPSHYPPNFNGWKNPAEKPYDVILYAMTKARDRALAASTTPAKLRPWLQDFTIYGVAYTPEMIREEKKATYDSGLDSWMMWNAGSKYTAKALDSSMSSTTIATSTNNF